jgi:phospholipase D1/2
VAFHIRKRIERAFLEKKRFRVIIVIPLVPGFPGDMYKTQNKQTILKYTYRSICRNRGLSILESLRTMMGDRVQDYISFLSLRNHALIGEIPKTEEIYVHSKSMIIDDEVTLVGSANINDRSLLGTRDSEVCAIVRDSNGYNQVNGIIDGKPTIVSKFTRDFRLKIFKVRTYIYKATFRFFYY